MAGLSKVFVIDPDDRARHQLRLGFAREGVPVDELPVPADVAKLDLPVDDTPPGLIVVGGADGRGLDILRRIRTVLEERQLDAPIVFTGRGVRRTDAEQAGADEVVLLPTYLRDIVTVGRLLRDRPADQREQLVGSLAETTGVFTLVRALSALGRSAVLTLIRGLRRGEVRFYHGEVTSAQVGLIHGQAALHQLLLWTDARFDFHREDIVRRHQIPLDHDELFADAERFLTGIRDSAGQLSPSMVLEQDMQRIQAYGRQIPTEVHGVLRMFDGHRVLADVLEDSPYRLFETLRVAQRAMDVGLLRAASQTRKKATWRAVLAIEEWLVGTEAPERDPALAESGPLTQTATRESQRMKSKGTRKRKKRRANTPIATTASQSPPPADIDWGALVPRTVGAEVGPLAGVVPASKTSGEFTTPATRDNPRERLESVMDTTQREKIFASDLGQEPSVVIGAEPSAPIPTVSDAARTLAEAETMKLASQARAIEADELRKRGEADALERARAEAEAHKKAKLEAEAAEKAAADENAAADKAAADKAAADKAAADKAAAEAKVDDDTVDDPPEQAASDIETAVKAAADKEQEKLEAWAAKSASSLVKDLVVSEANKHADKPLATEGVITTETPTATVTEGDRVRIMHTEQTARLVAEPIATITEAKEPTPAPPTPAEDKPATIVATLPVDTVPKRTSSDDIARRLADDDEPKTTPFVRAESPPSGGTPSELVDESSDGVPREPHTTVETAPLPPPRGSDVADDRPPDKTGEIATRAKRPTPAEARTEPSILVADIAAAQEAVAAVVAKQAAAPPSKSVATPARAATVAQVKADVAVFSDDEEAFFKQGSTETAQVPRVPSESFDDLDEGYKPQTFWERLVGKAKKPKP